VQAVSYTATGQSVSIQCAGCILYSNWSVCIYTVCRLYRIQQLVSLYLYSVQAVSYTATGQSVSTQCAGCILYSNWSVCIYTVCRLYPVQQLVSLYLYSVQAKPQHSNSLQSINKPKTEVLSSFFLPGGPQSPWISSDYS